MSGTLTLEEIISAMQADAAPKQTSNGVMLALMPDAETAQRIAVPTGIAPDDLHATLCYCGKVDELQDGEAAAGRSVVDDLVDMYGCLPLEGEIATTAPLGTDGAHVGILSVKGLDHLRVQAHTMLRDSGVQDRSDHGFVPHMSLTYGTAGGEALKDLSGTKGQKVRFDRLMFKAGDQSYSRYLGSGSGRLMSTLQSSATIRTIHYPHIGRELVRALPLLASVSIPLRYTLGVVYQPNVPDFFFSWMPPEQVQRVCWEFGLGPKMIGLMHQDDTLGHGFAIENYIYRGPTHFAGDQIIATGSWLVGAIWDDKAWPFIQSRQFTGWSMQGWNDEPLSP